MIVIETHLVVHMSRLKIIWECFLLKHGAFCLHGNISHIRRTPLNLFSHHHSFIPPLMLFMHKSLTLHNFNIHNLFCLFQSLIPMSNLWFSHAKVQSNYLKVVTTLARRSTTLCTLFFVLISPSSIQNQSTSTQNRSIIHNTFYQEMFGVHLGTRKYMKYRHFKVNALSILNTYRTPIFA